MPWGWECRAKLIKQVPAKPTKRKGKISGETPTPSAAQYEPPEIIGKHIFFFCSYNNV